MLKVPNLYCHQLQVVAVEEVTMLLNIILLLKLKDLEEEVQPNNIQLFLNLQMKWEEAQQVAKAE